MDADAIPVEHPNKAWSMKSTRGGKSNAVKLFKKKRATVHRYYLRYVTIHNKGVTQLAEVRQRAILDDIGPMLRIVKMGSNKRRDLIIPANARSTNAAPWSKFHGWIGNQSWVPIAYQANPTVVRASTDVKRV